MAVLSSFLNVLCAIGIGFLIALGAALTLRGKAAMEVFRFAVAVLLVMAGVGAGMTMIGLYMLCETIAGTFA